MKKVVQLSVSENGHLTESDASIMQRPASTEIGSNIPDNCTENVGYGYRGTGYTYVTRAQQRTLQAHEEFVLQAELAWQIDQVPSVLNFSGSAFTISDGIPGTFLRNSYKSHHLPTCCNHATIVLFNIGEGIV